MKMHKLLICTLLLGLLLGCGEDVKDPNQLFSLTITNSKKSFKVEDKIAISVSAKRDKAVENVAYTLNGNPVTLTNNELSLEGQRMGVHNLEAAITSGDDTYTLSKEFTVTATQSPTLYTYTVLDSYPHDMNAYTQGLEFENDTLYESTGQRKKSTLRKTNYETGEVIQNIKLGDQYFGEGLTILDDKIYQLTWQKETGFIYNLTDMQQTGTFVYGKSKEGWGLCNDGNKVYKSDGTQRIWTLNSNTLAEENYIEIYTNKSKIDQVNELEWVDGKIYANIYQKDAIAIVNPTTGAVEGVINMKGLQDQVTQHSQLDVLNGIAYNGEPNILYVTGKNWDKLFKIEISEK